MAVNTHAYARTLAHYTHTHAHAHHTRTRKHMYTHTRTHAHTHARTHVHTHCEVVDPSDDGPVEDQLGRVALLPVQRARAALPNQLLNAAAAEREKVWPHLTDMHR